MNPHLQQLLKSSNLDELEGFAASAESLHALMDRTGQVQRVRSALRTGELVESDIRQFAQLLINELKLGERLPGDVALAAVAVALESFQATHNFAEEYIRDLSRVSLVEMNTSSRVARVCLRTRSKLTLNHAKPQQRLDLPASRFQFNWSSTDNRPTRVSHDAAA